ncbi:MAG: alpha/beta hydrolase, partial [Blautia sp.]|nr:alpha/beta hydrolase [Blautia sp.]
SQGVSQFIAYGTKDGMVGMNETIRYIEEAKNEGCNIKDIVAEGADHGFGQEYYMENYLQWIASIWE